MKNKTAKQIVNSYRLACVLLALLYIVVLVALILVATYVNFLIAMIAIMLLGSSVRSSFEKLRKKYIESVIYEDLDPEKFGEILTISRFKKSAKHRMLYYLSSGKHDDVLALVEEKEKKTTHPIDKCNNLYRIGYVHFERGEYDKLPEVFKKYEKIKKENPKFQYALNSFSVFDKFDAFADEDYEYVLDVCNIDLSEIDTKKQNHKLTKINVSFYRAVSLYKLERFDEAKEAFEEIIEFAPKMHKAQLSKEFLELIKTK